MSTLRRLRELSGDDLGKRVRVRVQGGVAEGPLYRIEYRPRFASEGSPFEGTWSVPNPIGWDLSIDLDLVTVTVDADDLGSTIEVFDGEA